MKHNLSPNQLSSLELADKAALFRSDLLRNWVEFKRFFAWRETQNPFHILVSEMLLQKTNAGKVERVYKVLIERYPTPFALSSADPEDLSPLLAPLGLAYRVVRLISMSDVIVKKYDGLVPNNTDELISLPGVGHYTARAVACFAYNRKCLPWDTNIIRISGRVFNLHSSASRPRTDLNLADRVGNLLLTDEHTKETVWAVLDFASRVCTASKPKCRECFAREYCFFVCSTRNQA